MVKQVVQLKNDVKTMSASEYPSAVKVGMLLRALVTFCFLKHLFTFNKTVLEAGKLITMQKLRIKACGTRGKVVDLAKNGKGSSSGEHEYV